MTEHHGHLGVAVLTTSGRWPEHGFEKAPTHEKVQHVLDQAIRHLHLAGTQGWIAMVGSKELNAGESFEKNGVTTGDAVIDFGPRHGGGGRA
jgi:hypothetical protein